MSTPHPNTVLFARGTIARLALWPALRLAVYASWGGPASAEKQRWLTGVLVDQFESFLVAPPPHTRAAATASTTSGTNDPPPDDVYVEELLLQIIADEFDVALEDDSAAQVARDVVRLFDAACKGDDTFVKELEVQADAVKGKVPKYEVGAGRESDWEDEEDEGEDESEGESAPQLLNHSEPRIKEEQMDQDGFTLVTKKGRR